MTLSLACFQLRAYRRRLCTRLLVLLVFNELLYLGNKVLRETLSLACFQLLYYLCYMPTFSLSLACFQQGTPLHEPQPCTLSLACFQLDRISWLWLRLPIRLLLVLLVFNLALGGSLEDYPGS